MGNYTADQWVLFFFFYCFCGWVWESCYVSVRQRAWVNRGFLHGPLLPIYGSGAVIILLATIPVEGNLALVYLFGMIAATVLEYFTGAAMERLFKVRYWDYSQQRWNLNGYICLSSSLAWGFFSILLVRFLHPPIARLVLRIPDVIASPLALALVAALAADTMSSFRAAMDLRETLVKLTEENEELRRLAKRVEIISTFAEEDLQRFRDRTQVERILFQDRLEAERNHLAEVRAERKLRREELAEEALRRRTDAKLQALENLIRALEECRGKLEKTLSGAALEERRAEVEESLKKLRDREAAVRSRSARAYRQALRILRGNPTARTRDYGEALENLRRLGKGGLD